jgi:hypothetical protein
MLRDPTTVALTLLLTCVLSGCRSGPAPDSGFLEDPERMTENERFPFQRVWYDPDAAWDGYTELIVAPVHTEHLMAMPWWKEVSFPGDRREGARELGLYLQSRVFDAFEADPEKRFTPVAFAAVEPGPHTLLLEMALVELHPTRPVLKVLGGPTDLGAGSVAIEGRFRDATTDRIIAMFADRELAKRSFINVADLTWYTHAREIADEWANQLVGVANAGPDDRVERSSRFKLRPW